MYSKGFSLLEMIIYFVILGVLAAITVPGAVSMFDQVRLNRAIWAWIGHIDEARELAIERHQKIIFAPLANNAWTQEVIIKNEVQILKQYEPLGENFNVTWHGFPIQTPYLIFQSDGTLENENGHFRFCFKANCRSIVIAKGGKVHLEAH